MTSQVPENLVTTIKKNITCRKIDKILYRKLVLRDRHTRYLLILLNYTVEIYFYFRKVIVLFDLSNHSRVYNMYNNKKKNIF